MCSIQYQPCFDQAFRIGPDRRRIPFRPPVRVPVRPGSIVSGANQILMQFNANRPGGVPGSVPGVQGLSFSLKKRTCF